MRNAKRSYICKITKIIVKCSNKSKQMAIQKSSIKLSGKLGDLVHYQRNEKYFTKSAAQGDHQFSAGSIAAQQSFGLGSTMGKHLKLALKPLLDTYQYEGIHNRLTEACKQIFRAGPVLKKESKQFTDHNIKLLTGLNLNKYTHFDALVRSNPIHLSFGADGLVKLSIAEHIPSTCFYLNKKTHAVSIQFLFSIIDLETPAYTHLLASELVIPLREPLFHKKEGKIQLPSLEGKLVICTTQVRYYQHAEMQYHSGNRKLIAAEITHVAHIKNGSLVSYPPTLQKKTVKKAAETPSVPINWE